MIYDKIITTPEDERICRSYGLGFQRSTANTAEHIVAALYKTDDHRQPFAVHALTPAGAREMALVLWRLADDADKKMNEALSPKEGA